MKPVVILSDNHANLPALLAVLREVQTSGAERVIFLGDLVGYGASPAECVNWVRKLGGACVMGNHDVEIENVRRPGFRFYEPEWQQRGYQAGLAHAAKSLDMEPARWLARLPYTMTIPGAVAAHGSWNDPEISTTSKMPRARHRPWRLYARASSRLASSDTLTHRGSAAIRPLHQPLVHPWPGNYPVARPGRAAEILRRRDVSGLAGGGGGG